jgi:nitric oxide reductase large subunit
MTAVEWLIQELSKSIHFHRVLNEINENSTIERDVLKEAKQLEKSHMINFFSYGCMTQSNNLTSERILEQFRNYYEKQFKDSI